MIAEAGVAHFGSFEKALELVDIAVEANADAVKFQIFDVDQLIAKESSYWKTRLGTKALPYEAFADIKSYCQEKDITFLATAHEEKALDYLTKLDVAAYKIGSGEYLNWPFIEMVLNRGRPVIVSTGLYNDSDVDILFAIATNSGNPDFSILHCVTSYPTDPQYVDLNVINKYKSKYDVVVGYSDHTVGTHISLAAVALGAKIIEKHITLEFNIPDADDWKVSVGREGLVRFINDIREVEAAFGTGHKKRQIIEDSNLKWARKSLVSVNALAAGTIIEQDMLNTKRPGYGIRPDDQEKVIGRRLVNNVEKDVILTWDDIE